MALRSSYGLHKPKRRPNHPHEVRGQKRSSPNTPQDGATGGGVELSTSFQQICPSAALRSPKLLITVYASMSMRFPLGIAFSVQQPSQSLSLHVSATSASIVFPIAEMRRLLPPYDLLSPFVVKNDTRLLLVTNSKDCLPSRYANSPV